MATNIANIVFPGHFNPKSGKWCDYKEQLQCALDAAGISESELKNKGRSLFLSQYGKYTYSLIASLLAPATPISVEFKEILSVLDKFFEPEAENQPVLIRMYGPGEKWQRATVEVIEGPSSYRVRTEDGELHRRHADQILACIVTPQVINQDPIADNRTARSPRSGTATPDMPIEIPPPEYWPDIIGIPSTDQSNIL